MRTSLLMPPNKYNYEFTSQNDENEKFTLTFEVVSLRREHSLVAVKVYQHRGDMFCKVTTHKSNARHSLHVESIHNAMKFGIDIYVRPDGCEIFVVENVLTTIAHTETLKPCL